MASKRKHDETVKIIAQFRTPEGETTGPQLEIPAGTTPAQLVDLINTLQKDQEKKPYSFFIQDLEVNEPLDEFLKRENISTEVVLPIVYRPQSIFRVRAVTRCSNTLQGHTEAVLSTAFSGDGKELATGSGDATIRLWDMNTATPRVTLKGHKSWVLVIAWSPDQNWIASGGKDNTVRIWDPKTGKCRKTLRKHTKWITSLVWEPMHINPACRRVASGSGDGSIKVWDVVTGDCLLSLTGHTGAVRCLRWGGVNGGLLYSGSADRTIKVWETKTGKLVRTLEGHGHWVNSLSLSTDYAMRTPQGKAMERYQEALHGKELLVSGSDDFTLYLWDPAASKKPIARLVGHQQPVNWVLFSPDGLWIASASFDKSVRLWNGRTGKFVTTFRGHVQSVYQVAWSSDSRMLCSSSADSTIKIWDPKSKKVMFDLPGHADEVYAVDWSPDGLRVASGGKDRVVKIWRR